MKNETSVNKVQKQEVSFCILKLFDTCINRL